MVVTGSEEHLDEPFDLRQRQADDLPFFLRAWWLRNFLEAEGLVWSQDLGITSPLWSLYSDPLCDVGSVDQKF